MRRSLLGLVLATAAVTLAMPAHATFRAKKRAVAQSDKSGISSVTDGDGNPIQVRSQVGVVNETSVHPKAADVQRGQDWWPFSSALPPYTAVSRRPEALNETEIAVNGVAILDTRDVGATMRLIPNELKLADESQLAQAEGFYLLKIAGFSRTQEQIDALTRAGATLGEYLNINTYIAKIPSASMAAVKALPFVTFVGDYQPAYKLSPRIGLDEVPADQAFDPVTGAALPWVFEVVLHKGAYLNDVLDGMARIGVFPTGDDIISNDALTFMFVRTAPDALPALAQIPGVKWIAEKTYPRLLASSTNPAAIPMILQNNGTYTTNKAAGWKLWNVGIDGSVTHQIVTMMDSGLNTKMFHFSQDTVSNGTVGPAHRKVVGYDAYGSGDQCVLDNSDINDGGHGAKTSQHAVGSISNMTSNQDVTHVPNENWDDGIARGAKVYFEDIGNNAGGIGPPADLTPSITAAIVKGSYVQNHSWGAATNAYDSRTNLLDTALVNNPDFVVTVSAGNSGAGGIQTLGSPGTAKNVITVGGNDAFTPNGLFIDCNWDGNPACDPARDLGSSRGPVSGSLRTKPDIMSYIWAQNPVGGEQMAYDAPSAMCQTDATKTPYFSYANLGNEGGTSFAAPDVAGLAALVRDYFMQGFYPTGTATPGNAFTPRGSLVKAVILASGEDMNSTATPTTSIGINKRYSSDVGYGRVNLPGTLHIGGGAPFLWVQNGDTVGQSGTRSFTYNINNNSVPLRVMMVYYDTGNDAIVKDADLKVTINPPGGTVYWGNNFSGGWSTSATATRDHTNPTEGVFLDAAHGLPASGTVQVDVIGFNNPGGLSYSLVVSGNVASASVQQVSLNKGVYTCNEAIGITVNDGLATSPVNVTVVSKNSSSTVIDTKVVSCTGSGGVFTGSIQTGSGLTVANGGSISVSYASALPATASVACQATVTDAGFLISGGCDNNAAGTNEVTGPLFNGGSNEFYTKYMDAGEYTSYKMGFVNQTGVPLTDATVSVSFSGPGASKMSALNGPIHIGPVAVGDLAGPVFQFFTDPSAAGVAFPTTVNLNFSITSPADGFTTPIVVTQTQLLQANDTVLRQNRCSTFNTSLSPWVESRVTAVPGSALNPWRWSGVATTPSIVSSENRTDGMCFNSTANAAAMTGNSAISSGFNFNGAADSVLLQNFQPALIGNAPNGQPYRYAWKWNSFYHASETLNAATGVWAAFYNDQWNSAVNPTGDQVTADFPFGYGYFFQNQVFDYLGTWNWDTANGGTPDDPTPATRAPNQIIINFIGVTGTATPTTFFSYGQEHVDYALFQGGSSTALTRRDIAFDNDNLVYDEFFASQQGAACTPGTQPGQVAFDQVTYNQCPNGSAVISLLDANGVSGMTATVTSPGTGDSETVTLTGSAPYFSGTLNFSMVSGVGTNNGTLFVLPSETLSATYSDASPVGSTVATAVVQCPGGDVQYVTNAQIVDSGDNDGLPDNNECVTMDITIKNNTANTLSNTKVTIVSNNANVDLIEKDHAYYGSVGAGSNAVNASNDRFTFHVNPSVACSDPANPPVASFTVIITADGINGAAALQTLQVNLDLDVGAGTTNYTQSFTANPGWQVGVTPPENAPCTQSFTNDFHWCALCGNGGGGYGAWVGNSAFGTPGQNYTSDYNSSTLYSPVFTAGGPTTLQFRTAYRTEGSGFDGAIVQYQIGAGGWNLLGYTTPAQSATTSGNFCSPIAPSTVAWTGTATGTAWTLTNAAGVPTTNGQSLQFRWRLGGDQSGNGSSYGGFGVDDVTVTGLRQFICEPTRNGAAPCCLSPGLLVNNNAVDVNLCSTTGVQISWPKDPDNWGDGGAGTRTYDVLRNGVPIQTGIAYGTTTYTDTTGTAGTSYTYTVRYNNGCGNASVTAGASKADATPVTCSASDQCHNVGVCAPSTGLCSNPPKTDGSGCSDGDLCTQTDTCQSGVCLGGNPIVCFQQDQCHQIGTCAAGVCSNPIQPNGTSCDDGVGCTASDQCTAGSCAGTPTPPGEIVNSHWNNKTNFVWDTVPNSPVYDILRGAVSALPVGPGGGDETCFDNQATAVFPDAATPIAGDGFWYLVRAANACGQGNYGTQHNGSPRTTTTCP